MDIFTKDDAYNDQKFPITSGSKRRYKKTKGGQDIVCEIIQKIVDDELKEAEKRIAQIERDRNAARADADAAKADADAAKKRIAELEAILAQKTKSTLS